MSFGAGLLIVSDSSNGEMYSERHFLFKRTHRAGERGRAQRPVQREAIPEKTGSGRFRESGAIGIVCRG